MNIKTSLVKNGKQDITSKQVTTSKLVRQDIQEEIKLLLAKHDLTMNDIISRYKEILSEPHKQPLASDIVKVLENLQKLHNIEAPGDKTSVTVILAGKSNTEIREYLTDITSKTQNYLDKLKAIEGETVK